MRIKALTAYQAQGGKKNQLYKCGWLGAVPGLTALVELLAWTTRGESPVIHVSASRSDVAGREQYSDEVKVTMERWLPTCSFQMRSEKSFGKRVVRLRFARTSSMSSKY